MKKMSKILAAVMIAALLVSTLVIPASAGSNIKFVKTTATANIRISPNKNSEKIGTAKKGEVFGYDRTKKDSRGVLWYGLVYGSYGTAWLSSKNAVKCNRNGKVIDPTKKPTPETTPKPIDYSTFKNADYYVTITGSSVNMRYEPATDRSVIASYPFGTVLYANRTNGSWTEVIDENTGRKGYISNKYLEEYVEPAADETVDPELDTANEGTVNNYEELAAVVPNATLINAPEGSTNVTYKWIYIEEYDAYIAEISFSYEGTDFVLRAAPMTTDDSFLDIDGITLDESNHDEESEDAKHLEFSADGTTAVVHFNDAASRTQYSLTGPAIMDGAVVEALADQLFPNSSEEGNLEDDGEETLNAENGVTLSFNRYNWKVDTDEDGTISGVYLGDASEYVGFDIVRSTGTDAKAYMTEAAESYNVELDEGNCFNDEKTWYSFTNTVTENDSTTMRTVYARNNSDGAWIVTAYGYIDSNEERNELISDELSMVLDSLTFAD